MSILNKIVEDKIKEVEIELSGIAITALSKIQENSRIPLDFKKQLQGPTLSIIAEVKKASPSKGLIRPDFDPVAIARSYYDSGADCISVLTEKKYFQGSTEYLKSIRNEVNIPLLRKDFIVDKRQIREAYDLGADAILLIASVLSENKLSEFNELAAGFGMTCLVEVHSEEELDLVLNLGFDLIGINNRNLKTFHTDIMHSIKLRKRIPDSIITVSESGIMTPDDCLKLKNAGFNAVLVGETLMRQTDPGSALQDLMRKVR